MVAASLFAVMLRRPLSGSPNIFSFRSSSCPLLDSLRPLSSSLSRNEGFAVEEDHNIPEDDLRSRIFRLRLPKRSATAALDRWVGEGRTATASELRQITKDLRRSQRYKHALEISEWMKTHRESELSNNDYGLRIDLITKVFGINAAEDFFERLPSTAKSCEAYTALLHSYAAQKLIEKAEKLFERIKELNICSNALVHNEMMTLYISVGQLDKVSLVIEELKRQKVSPDLFSYNLWISSCAATMDINAVRKILDEMAQESRSDKHWITYAKLTDIYLSAGRLVNSENSLSEADKRISQQEWISYDFLIILHAGLGNMQMLNEIWKSMRMTTQKMTCRSYICIIASYLVLEQFKEAGEVIEQWMQSKAQEFDISDCNRLFDAFKKTGLVDRAEKFQEMMLQKDCKLTNSL